MRRPEMPRGTGGFQGPMPSRGLIVRDMARQARPVNPPRVKGDPTGRKVAVKVEGSRSWGKDPNWGGERNGEAGAPSAINRVLEKADARLDRKWAAFRRERKRLAAIPVRTVTLPGVEQQVAPMRRVADTLPSDYRPPKVEHDAPRPKDATAPTWGSFGMATVATMRSRWR